MTMPLSQKEYINTGSRCPNCGEETCEMTGSADGHGRELWQDCECNECGATWTELYRLTGYDNLKTDDSPAN